ncbi:MAG: sigma-70 family RNA polymerase sigma factor, partial [Planctomycetota bacterium]
MCRECPDHSGEAPAGRGEGAASVASVIDTHWPWVVSVCRGVLGDLHEAEDAAQETFAKYVRLGSGLRGDVRGWLSTAARTTATDRLRKRVRDRRRDARYADRLRSEGDGAEAAARRLVAREAVWRRLPEALSRIDASAAELLVERFLQETPLRVIAAREGMSVPTASRRCAAAVTALSEALSEMGVMGLSDLPVVMALSALGSEAAAALTRDVGLRPGRWAAVAPGGSRRRRVGVFVSHRNAFVWNQAGFTSTLDHQAQAAAWLDDASAELVAVVDPGSEASGPIESTVRLFELYGGLMTIDDAAALGTLDVLLLGNNFYLSGGALSAVLSAVRGGVGLYQEGHCGSNDPGPDDPRLRELMLAASPVVSYCSGKPGTYEGHAQPIPGVVRSRHPAFPWLVPGGEVTISSCGSYYRPASGAVVVVSRTAAGRPNEQVSEDAPTFVAPAVIAGPLGRGRVAIAHFTRAELFFG